MSSRNESINEEAEIEIIKEISKKYRDKLIETRRWLHSHPELGYEEYETSKYVAKILLDLGIEVKEGVAKTGVVGLLRGNKQGKTIAIRADMDGLPIQEENDVSYKSKNQGKMHACGHDVHIAAALGVAMILSDMKDKLFGNVKFIFQPAEETEGGAKPLIEDGVLDNPKVDAIISGHVWSEIPSGKIGIKKGPIMASTDFFELKIIGKAGHAARPNVTIDPIILGSEVVCGLQKIVSRQTDPLDNVVISVTCFQSGNSFNVIPGDTIIKGTVRALNENVRRQIPEKMENIIRGIVESNGANYHFNYIYNYPVTVNDSFITYTVKDSAIKIIGKENVLEIVRPSMGGEDFSYFLQEVPGTFIWIGIRNEEKNIVNDIHHPKFDIDESILETTTSIYAQAILDLLNSNSYNKKNYI